MLLHKIVIRILRGHVKKNQYTLILHKRTVNQRLTSMYASSEKILSLIIFSYLHFLLQNR